MACTRLQSISASFSSSTSPTIALRHGVISGAGGPCRIVCWIASGVIFIKRQAQAVGSLHVVSSHYLKAKSLALHSLLQQTMDVKSSQPYTVQAFLHAWRHTVVENMRSWQSCKIMLVSWS